MSFLVDSGAAVSVVPRSRVKDVTVSQDVKLKAVNGSDIQTYGKRTFRLQLGRAHFTHNFVVADLPGVLGWDWMSQHGIHLTWKSDGKCKLSAGRKTIPVTMGRPSNELLGLQLAEVDFKTYSAAHKVTEKGENDIPPVYQKLLAKYPNIDKPDFRKTPAH